MKAYSVNEALENKVKLQGQRIYVEGLLSYDVEDISLVHWPKAEQSDRGIWIEESNGVFKYNFEALETLAGKKVVCLGEFQSSNTSDTLDGDWGFGHMNLWQAQLIATELVYYKIWHAANCTLKT
ncbi:MAG: hypothetical protein ACRBBR_16015 [Cellvibrionaceae bacterium]